MEETRRADTTRTDLDRDLDRERNLNRADLPPGEVDREVTSVTKEGDANRDPITDAPGADPVGVGIGAAGAGAAGAAIGAVAGPVGAAVGAVVGAVAGGLAGKGVAEAVNPTVEEAYWRDVYRNRPYIESGATYDEYGPAYRYGWESYSRYGGRKYEDVERDLERDWDTSRGDSSLTWECAKHATRDAWHRVERAMPGDFDKDGR